MDIICALVLTNNLMSNANCIIIINLITAFFINKFFTIQLFITLLFCINKVKS
jgi:hypothetical protein